MKLIYQNSQEFLNKLVQIVNFMAAMPMIIFVFLFIKIENNDYFPDILGVDALFLARITTFILVAGIIGIAVYRFKTEVKAIRDMEDLRSKMDKYYTATKIRCYWYETATVIALMGMALSGEGIYALFYSMTLVAFSIGYPTVLKIANQLRLKGEERNIILKKQDIPW